MEKQVTKAMEIMFRQHEGQKRKFTNEPYAEHPIRVRENALRLFEQVYPNYHDSIDQTVASLRAQSILSIVAYLHDVEEDTDMNLDSLVEEVFGDFYLRAYELEEYQEIKNALILLNRGNYKNYFEYIKAIKEDFYARLVKLADLQDNMSDLKEGSMKDKYRFARAYLEEGLYKEKIK